MRIEYGSARITSPYCQIEKGGMTVSSLVNVNQTPGSSSNLSEVWFTRLDDRGTKSSQEGC